jgi:hypothetical protein
MQGGLKLDMNIIKDFKFTSQFNGEYYNFKSYNYADSKAIWLAADPTRLSANYLATDPTNLLNNTKQIISIGC